MLLIFGIDLSKKDGFDKLKAYIEMAEDGSTVSAMLREIEEEIEHARLRGLIRNRIVLENVLELVHNYSVARELLG